jgi:hypothetical protein
MGQALALARQLGDERAEAGVLLALGRFEGSRGGSARDHLT